jgi:hypothetical protein
MPAPVELYPLAMAIAVATSTRLTHPHPASLHGTPTLPLEAANLLSN